MVFSTEILGYLRFHLCLSFIYGFIKPWRSKQCFKEQETRILYQHIEIVKGHIPFLAKFTVPFLRYSFTKPSFFLKGFKISLPILNFLRSLRWFVYVCFRKSRNYRRLWCYYQLSWYKFHECLVLYKIGSLT